MLVQINPIQRDRLPTQPWEIADRVTKKSPSMRVWWPRWLIKYYKLLGNECSVNIARDYLDDLRLPVERSPTAATRTHDILP